MKRGREATAYHEAGHAVACVVNDIRITRPGVTIAPEGDRLGILRHQAYLRPETLSIERTPRSVWRAERLVVVALAGPVSQRAFRPHSYRAHQGAADHECALEILWRLAGSEREVRLYHQLLQERARNLVSARWAMITAVAECLLERATLDHSGVQRAMNSAISPQLRAQGTYYHRTSVAAAKCILREGFRDGCGTYLTDQLLSGVWISDRPLDASEGATGEVLLKIEVPADLVRDYEWREDGKPYREFMVPADTLNWHGRVQVDSVEPSGKVLERDPEVREFYEAFAAGGEALKRMLAGCS